MRARSLLGWLLVAVLAVLQPLPALAAAAGFDVEEDLEAVAELRAHRDRGRAKRQVPRPHAGRSPRVGPPPGRPEHRGPPGARLCEPRLRPGEGLPLLH